MMLPADLAEASALQGWGEPPLARLGLIARLRWMVYGPRDKGELELVWALLRASHACGRLASSP